MTDKPTIEQLMAARDEAKAAVSAAQVAVEREEAQAAPMVAAARDLLKSARAAHQMAHSEVLYYGKCRHMIWRDWNYDRCSRSAGYGKDADYCKQHAAKHPAE